MAVDVTHEAIAAQRAETTASAGEARAALDVQTTTCCIVGGGPAGLMLALCLARKNVPVMLLEAHHDFNRDFRGDTLHPSVLTIMDELGLADRLLDLPHTKMSTMRFQPPNGGGALVVDFSRLKTKHPYIALLPQVRFLEFVAQEAKRYPGFHLVFGADVRELIEEGGVVRGVRYRSPNGWHEVRALLTVGADGRFSRVRHLAGIEPEGTSPPMDVLWFRLPREPNEAHGAMGSIGHGHMVAMLERGDEWQIAYVIPKGTYQQLHAQGLEALREGIVSVVPQLADRVAQLQDWKQVTLLSVESSMCRRWYKPGLLLLGDAAHVMSPVGGVGINYAIADAVAAANRLAAPLQTGRLRLGDLAAVQRRRQWPTRIMQAIQTMIQQFIIAGAVQAEGKLGADRSFQPPFILRVPFLRDIPARLMAFGIWPVHVNT